MVNKLFKVYYAPLFVKLVKATKRTLRERFTEHKAYIVHKKDTLTGKHFCQPGHSDLNMIPKFIELMRGSPDSTKCKQIRKSNELKWIHNIGCTKPLGLNDRN